MKNPPECVCVHARVSEGRKWSLTNARWGSMSTVAGLAEAGGHWRKSTPIPCRADSVSSISVRVSAKNTHTDTATHTHTHTPMHRDTYVGYPQVHVWTRGLACQTCAQTRASKHTWPAISHTQWVHRNRWSIRKASGITSTCDFVALSWETIVKQNDSSKCHDPFLFIS